MAQDAKSPDLVKRTLEALPTALIIPLFFMTLCGAVLSYLLLQTHPKFTKYKKVTESIRFHLAFGFVLGAVVMIVFHGVRHRSMLSTMDELTACALPSSLLLAGITTVVLIWKLCTK